MTTVQDALEAVDGVQEVQVSLQRNEAVVTYDPEVAKVEDLITAVKEAQGMNAYDAAVKSQK